MQRHVLALALFALIAAPAVHAGCCTDKCKGQYTTAATEFAKNHSGCASDDQEIVCLCGWNYQGTKSTGNGCVDNDASGECVDMFDMGAALVGLGAAMKIAPGKETKEIPAAYIMYCPLTRRKRKAAALSPTSDADGLDEQGEGDVTSDADGLDDEVERGDRWWCAYQGCV
ncbi:hypothetical protein T484DRAFT_1851513 [Baffinella frigidus]|nr:hypothetical protein T484DRAFT_1851513 [Cryptophyta sp. CCMP2293]